MDVHIRDEKGLERKIEQFKVKGASGFHVVSDFDRTLTKAFVKGKKDSSVIAKIRDGKYLTEDYPKRAYDLFDEYHPFEMDPDLSAEERDKKMIEWWEKHFDLLIECGMNMDVVRDIIEKGKIQVRDGIFEFFDVLSKHNVPLLIFSAGPGDIIKEYLKSVGKLYGNTHLVSNLFKFNEDGVAVGYNRPVIHTFNKNEVQVKGLPYSREIKERRNVLLLGDSLGDLGMSEGIEHDCIIRVGFLNEKVDELFDRYMEAFDVVLLNDADFSYVNDLVRKII